MQNIDHSFEWNWGHGNSKISSSSVALSIEADNNERDHTTDYKLNICIIARIYEYTK